VKSTAPSDDGDDNVHYLDRHNVDCGNSGNSSISEMVLHHPESSQFSYDYMCCDNAFGDRCYTRYTDWNADGYVPGTNPWQFAIAYLGRHNVACERGDTLSQVQLESQGDGPPSGQMRYRYTCCQRNPGVLPLKCSAYQTNPSGSGHDVDIHELDRHNIKCPSAQFLEQFVLQTEGGSLDGDIFYNFTCCSGAA
jgi:hypothetical protein